MTTDSLISRLRAVILKLRTELYRHTKHEILNKLESELAAHEAATPAAFGGYNTAQYAAEAAPVERQQEDKE